MFASMASLIFVPTPSALDRERAHRATAHDRAPHAPFTQIAGSREIAEKTAGERIACSSRIEHALERICGREENTLRVEHEGAMLALLDDDVFRAVRHDP